MLDRLEASALKTILGELERRTAVVVLGGDRDGAFLTELTLFAQEIAGLSPLIAAEGPLAVDSRLTPALLVTNQDQRSLYYAGLPRGHEIPAFLRNLVRMGNGRNSLKRETVNRLDRLSRDVLVEILVMESCPVCPKAVELACQFATCTDRIIVQVVDVARFPDVARKYRALSAPTVVINERAQIVGSVSEGALSSWIEKAVSEDGLLDVLASLLVVGNSQQAQHILNDENRLDLLASLMARPEFTVRVGTMLLIEELIEESPGKAVALVPGLIELLRSEMTNIRGDAAFMLGRIGDRRAVEPLSSLLSDDNQDLLEIAEEALATIRGGAIQQST